MFNPKAQDSRTWYSIDVDWVYLDNTVILVQIIDEATNSLIHRKSNVLQ